jgi:hypothetical protein
MNMPDMEQKPMRLVILGHQASFPGDEPLTMSPGESIATSDRIDRWNGNPDWVWIWCTDPRGRSGFVPQAYLAQQRQAAIALRVYSSRELSVAAGEMVETGEQVSGWTWCVSQQGQSGWVPTDHLEAGS